MGFSVFKLKYFLFIHQTQYTYAYTSNNKDLLGGAVGLLFVILLKLRRVLTNQTLSTIKKPTRFITKTLIF